jgi:uncharacterized membrane protein YhaH (DUF805 family)
MKKTINKIIEHPFLLKPIGRMDYLLWIIGIKLVQAGVSFMMMGTGFGQRGMMAFSPTYIVGVNMIFFLVIELALSIALFSFGSKRLRDIGESQYLLLLLFIPFVNIIFSLYLIFKKGKHGHHTHHVVHHHHEEKPHVHDQESAKTE